MNYDYTNNFNGMIDDLIDGYQDGTFDPNNIHGSSPLTDNDFNAALLEGLEDQRADFWKLLLQYMYNEASHFNDSSIIKESYFPENFSSFVKMLNNNIDIDKAQNWDVVWEGIKEQIKHDGAPLWNESVTVALKQFFNTFGEDGKIYLRKPDSNFPNGVYISIKDIMRANAGDSFSGTPWVAPNKNTDDKTYDEVRGIDKITSVLNDDSNLQFTREFLIGENDDAQFNTAMARWTRLIMPEYLRSVEVEDLNRNFWVIGQTLSALCAFLFGPDAPFSGLYEKIFNELVQLWENVMYLWLYAAISSQTKEITDCHIEVVPISNNELQNYIKFDNFDKDGDRDYPVNQFIASVYEASIAKSKYIIDQYSNSNIILFPKFRYDNYKHNYYSREIWPCVIFYNRNTGKMTCRPIYVYNDNPEVGQPPWFDEFLIDIKVKDLRNKLWSIKEDEINWEFISAEDAATDPQYEEEPYYSLIRTVPQISGYYKSENGEGHLYVDEFILNCYDLAAYLKDKSENGSASIEDYLIMYYSFGTGYNPEASGSGINDKISTNNYPVYRLEKTINENLPQPTTITPEPSLICQGYYQGEFPSWLWILGDLNPEVYKYEVLIEEIPLAPYSYRLEDIINLYNNIDDNAMTQAFNNYNINYSFIDDEDDFMKITDGQSPYETNFSFGSSPVQWEAFDDKKDDLIISIGWDFYTGQGDHQTSVENESNYEDYAKSQYNWNCMTFNQSMEMINGITKDQQILIYSSDEINQDNNIDRDVTKLILVTGYHPCEFSRNMDSLFGTESSSYCYKTINYDELEQLYVLEDEDWSIEQNQNKPILQYYPISHQEYVSHGAIIYNINSSNYNLYSNYHEINYVPYAFINQKQGATRLEGEKEVKRFQYILLPMDTQNKGRFENDWILVIQDICLGLNIKDEYISYRSQLDGNENSMVVSINIHIFTSHGEYVRKTIDRYREKSYSDNDTINPIDCITWKVKYYGDEQLDNKTLFERLYCGSIEQLPYTSPEEPSHRPKYSFFDLNNENHYNDFTNTPTQYKLYYNIYGGNNYDFNKYPNTGLAAKERVNVIYDEVI